MADDFKDELVTGLKVLAKVPPCGRLNIRNGMLNLESSGFWVPVKRLLMMQNRTQVLTHVRHLFTRTGEVLQGSDAGSFFKEQVREVKTDVVTGLENMKATYMGDAQTTAYIELLIERWKHVTLRVETEDV
jgi:hypothetical protein